MSATTLEIAVEDERLASVPARFERPATPREPAVAVLFAHGSRFGKDSPWTRAAVTGLLDAGCSVLSFDYAYRALAGDDPSARLDRTALLEHVHARALAALVERAPDARLVLAGKSAGARLSTLLAARGERCHGLLLYGYPLHPRDPERLLSEHFPTLVQPALFLQGERDPLCDPSLLRTELERYGGSATLEVIPDADHGFWRPGEAQEEHLAPPALAALTGCVTTWLDAAWP